MGDNVDPGGLHGGGQVVGRAAARPAARAVLRGDGRHDHGRGGPLHPGDLRRARARRTSARLEDEVVRLLALKRGDVIATGGGLPCRDGRAEALRALGTVVWLSGDFDALYERALRGGERPMLAGRTRDEVRGALSRARALLRARRTSPWTPRRSAPTRSPPHRRRLAALPLTVRPLDERAGEAPSE